MIRQREQIRRLAVKALSQVSIARTREGIGCSLFGAQALTEFVKNAYFPLISQPGAIQAQHVATTMVSADEPGTNGSHDARWCQAS